MARRGNVRTNRDAVVTDRNRVSATLAVKSFDRVSNVQLSVYGASFPDAARPETTWSISRLILGKSTQARNLAKNIPAFS
ncbi:MAG: hypothetical protein II655_10025 [Thermoguttaceae bacterium]|nr:hypothetical protein [Thermoguttaceae bacterium]